MTPLKKFGFFLHPSFLRNMYIYGMKKFFPLIFFSLISVRMFPSEFLSFRGVDFYASVSQSASVSDFRGSRLKADAGFKLDFSGVKGVLSIGLPDVGFLELPETFGGMGSWNAFDETFVLRYGASVSFSPGFLPIGIDLYAGTLNFSGGISRLKSPLLSHSSALKASVLPSSGISVSLPDFSSSEKAMSLALKFRPNGRNSWMPEIQAGADSDDSFFVSVSKSIPLPFVRSSVLSLNAASFVHGDDGSSSWFFDERPYLNDRFFGCSMEFRMKFQNAGVFVFGSLNQSPFGGLHPVFRTNVSLSFSGFVLNGGFYIANCPLVTVSGKKVSTWMQFQMNPWFRFALGPFKASTGLFFQGDVNESRSHDRSLYPDLFFRWDGRLNGSSERYSASVAFDRSWEDDSWKLSSAVAVKLKRSALDADFSVSHEYDGGPGKDKSSLDFSASVSPSDSVLKSLSASFSASMAGSEVSSASLGLSAEIRKRWGRVELNAALSFSLSMIP